MQTIYVLNQEVAFEFAAKILMDEPLRLSDVCSCTFPSRPEPKSAVWKTETGKKVIGYWYLPDIELRYLHLVDCTWERFEPGDFTPIATLFAEHTSVDLFSDWGVLGEQLQSDDHRTVVRAAWAHRMAFRHRDDNIDTIATLVEAIEEGDEPVRRVVAEVVSEIATAPFEERIRAIHDRESSADVRMFLRRAIDHIMTTL